MVLIRPASQADLPAIWTLSGLPNVGATADPSVPLRLPESARPPASFTDLADPDRSFTRAGGCLLVAQAGPQARLDTADNQPEAMAFYMALGYRETGREHQASWAWTLIYYAKDLT
jgi:hypothetical protein